MKERSVSGALALVVVFISGCSSAMPPQLRPDQNSYVFHGYYVDSDRAVDLVVEDIRYVPGEGFIVFELAVLNRRDAPVRVDFSATRLEIANHSLMTRQGRAVRVAPHAIERATLSFKSKLPPSQLQSGALRFSGVTTEREEAVEPFVVPFHVASSAELRAELGPLADGVE